MVTRKEVFSESSHHIETHIDVFIEVFDIQSSVYFELWIDEELIKLW